MFGKRSGENDTRLPKPAAAAPDEVCEGLTAGAHYYLTKPYQPSTLRTIRPLRNSPSPVGIA